MKEDVEILGIWAAKLVLEGDVDRQNILHDSRLNLQEIGKYLWQVDEVEARLWNDVLLLLTQEKQ